MSYELESNKGSRDKDIVALKKRLQELAANYKVIKQSEIKKNVLLVDTPNQSPAASKQIKALAEELKAEAAKVQKAIDAIYNLRAEQSKENPALSEDEKVAALKPLVSPLKKTATAWLKIHAQIIEVDAKYGKQLEKKKDDMEVLLAQSDAALAGEYQGVFREQSKDGLQKENSSKSEVADLAANKLTTEQANYLEALRKCYQAAFDTYNNHDCVENKNLPSSKFNIDKMMKLAEVRLGRNKFDPADFTLTKTLFAKLVGNPHVDNLVAIYVKGYPMPDAKMIGLANAANDAPKGKMTEDGKAEGMSAKRFFKKLERMLSHFIENLMVSYLTDTAHKMGNAQDKLRVTLMKLTQTNLPHTVAEEARKKFEATGKQPIIWDYLYPYLFDAIEFFTAAQRKPLLNGFFKSKFEKALLSAGLIINIVPDAKNEEEAE